jgi:hypothetical protein
MEITFEKMLKVALNNLNALERRGIVKFKVIVEDDEEHGTLEVVQKKRKRKEERQRRLPLYPRGDLMSHYKPYLDNLKPDDIALIPFGSFDFEVLRSSACAWCSHTWGNGTYSSTINREKQVVEIYRFPDEMREV